MNKLSIDKVELKGKRVLVRVDFNVPFDVNLNITDDTRIRAALPTIKKIIKDGGKTILISHLGRPKGQPKPEFSLKPVAVRLSELLDSEVKFASDCVGEQVEKIVESLKDSEVLLLENVRFYAEEEKNNPEFAGKLAKFGDVFINDAFGSAHRAHASTEGVTKFIKINAAGYLMQKEIDYLDKVVSNAEKPFTAILGGAKISGKIDVIQNLINKVDNLIIGGGMIFTFYKAMGYEIGKSLVEEEKIDVAKEIIEKLKNSSVKFLLPKDVVIASEFSNESESSVVEANKIPVDKLGLDIGPESIREFSNIIEISKTVVWNGPMGVFEFEKYAKGTFAIAKALANATEKGAVTVVGGGDSTAAINKAGFEDKVSHVSTGGGASLEFLEGKELPGVIALNNA
ncbi:MAG: phosphoglycerate kinase [Ignavibacteriales bacterium]|nr:phosphoglycerate kinase [Ignavibacteriales bacterium]